MSATLLLSVQDACIRFGQKTLFENLTFNIREGEKICLVGKNGAGKSTLMNIITNHCDLGAGERWQLQGLTIGYLQQEVTPQQGQSVYDYIFQQFKDREDAELHAYKVEAVVEPLQLNIKDQMTALSGGQLRRAALAKALVEDPDILLLDEPTNHLDLDIIEWLENYLKRYRGAFLCISHDRAFLAAISEQVYWLDRGKLKVCPRGYAYFDEWSTALLEQEERELQNRQKVLDIEVEWASRGVKARRKRNVRRLENMKVEREKLRSDKNALSRMLAKIDIPAIETEQGSSKIAVEFFRTKKSYYAPDGAEKKILDGFNLRIQRGDRIGVIGRNGAGKTTFLRLLTGEEDPDAGKVKMARDLVFSYFDQKRSALNPQHSLHRILCPNGGDYIEVMGKMRHVCGYLKDFMFDPRMASQPVSSLSGGQKNRLLLAKVLANPGAMMILDEPTNDLDMDTLDKLEDILSAYKGTLIVVSHDRDFLEQTVSSILAFEGDTHVEAVVGGYQDYILSRNRRLGIEEPEEKPAPKKAPPAPSPAAIATINVQQKTAKPVARMSYKEKYELEQLPEKIAKLEEEISTMEMALADPNLYMNEPEKFDQFSRRIVRKKNELETAETRWLELDAMAEAERA